MALTGKPPAGLLSARKQPSTVKTSSTERKGDCVSGTVTLSYVSTLGMSGGLDADVGVGMTEDDAGGLGEDYTLGVAHTLFAETDALGREGYMGVLGDVVRINHHS